VTEDLIWGLAKARDRVLVGRCDERYVQAVGQPPQRLGFRTDDFEVYWLAPDATYAVGLLHATRQSPNTPQRVIKRFADGRADHVLFPDTVDRILLSTDGGTIAVVTRHTTDNPSEPQAFLRLLRVETGEIRAIGSLTILSWVHWSPDGRRLVFTQRNTDVALTEPPSAERPLFGMAWTSWEEPTIHRIPGDATIRYDIYHRGTATWAPDSRHVLVYDQDPRFNSKPATLVTIDLAGKERTQPIVDAQGRPLFRFIPKDVAAGNPLVLGREGLLNSETGRVTPLETALLLRWSLEPGKLLRWQLTPEGPRLDTVAAPAGTP
jgi:hypothetical protein